MYINIYTDIIYMDLLDFTDCFDSPPVQTAKINPDLDILDINFLDTNISNPDSDILDTNIVDTSTVCMDYSYPLQWLDSHIALLENLRKDICTAIFDVKEEAQKGITFRSSTTKKVPHLQAIPVNLHVQIMGVQSLTNKSQKQGIYLYVYVICIYIYISMYKLWVCNH
jgi:hypothetical protein